MAAGPSGAASAIAALHARGWTDTAIGRMVGRNSSLIHQVAVGKKPGRNLAPALEALARSGVRGPRSSKQLPPVSLPSVEQRTRRSGLPARVRQSALGIEAERLPNGARFMEGHTKSDARHAAGLASALGDTARIQVIVTTAEGKRVVLGRKGGIRPDVLREYMRGGRTFRDALELMLADLYPPKQGAGPTSWHVGPSAEAQFYITNIETPREIF